MSSRDWPATLTTRSPTWTPISPKCPGGDRRDRAGRIPRPVHGVAVGIKDIIDVAGLRTRCGSGLFDEIEPAADDSEIVAALRAAGAVIVAKLHTHEFAYGPTGDIAFDGPCRNPRDEP